MVARGCDERACGGVGSGNRRPPTSLPGGATLARCCAVEAAGVHKNLSISTGSQMDQEDTHQVQLALLDRQDSPTQMAAERRLQPTLKTWLQPREQRRWSQQRPRIAERRSRVTR